MSFMFFAIGMAIIISAIRGGRGRRYRDLGQPQGPVLLEDPRVPRMQAEIDELRTQVERLTAAESFYAQLNAPAPAPRPGPELPAP
jgi:hypothetical protein